jgi:NADPH:quinone reductase-like Zn-dependent oxidoreductase
MKAVRFDRYGPPDVLRVAEIDRPVPKGDEILVKVHATTVNRSDCGFRGADPFFTRVFTGLRRPHRDRRTPGMEFAGQVVAVGPGVREFAVGDEVFGVRGAGAHAEYVTIAETRGVTHKPAGLSWEEAAALGDGPSIALAALNRADLEPGKRVLIYGASGSIGTAAVQIAKAVGAHVTAVCNGKNVELVRSLGADEVIDYEREDFTRNGETYDVIFDAVGKHSFRRSKDALVPGGLFLETDLGFMWHVPPLVLLTKWVGSKRVLLPIPRYAKEDVLRVKELVEEGKYRPVIDRTYPLERVVEATRYVETGQKTGNVVLTLNGATP